MAPDKKTADKKAADPKSADKKGAPKKDVDRRMKAAPKPPKQTLSEASANSLRKTSGKAALGGGAQPAGRAVEAMRPGRVERVGAAKAGELTPAIPQPTAVISQPTAGTPQPQTTPDLHRSTPGTLPEAAPAFLAADNRLVLMAIDPFWAWAYWEASPRALEQAKERAGDRAASLVIRFYDVASFPAPDPLDPFDGKSAKETFDVPIGGPSGNYYLNLWSPGKSLIAELGVKSKDGRFCPVARSNYLDLPRDGESPRYEDRRSTVLPASDSLWKPRSPPRLEAHPSLTEPGEPSQELAARVAEAALASYSDDDLLQGDESQFPTEWSSHRPLVFNRSMEERCDPHAVWDLEPIAPAEAASDLDPGDVLPSEWRESIGISSAEHLGLDVSSLEKPVRDERPQLEVKADIVIYGRARAGTDVVIDGVQVPVRSDGTFDVRFALPSPEKRAENGANRVLRAARAPSTPRAEPAPSGLNGPAAVKGG